MKVWLLRHGRTAWNGEHRYQGRTDVPLSPEGEAELRQAEFTPPVVYVSPLCRTGQTAAKLFPGAEQIVVKDLAEMDFGAFEGRNYVEMEHDPDYRAWVDGGCMGRCPGGEDWAAFSARVCGAAERLMEDGLARKENCLTVVAHGGVLMAVMERFALPERGYFDWNAPCGGGYVLDWEEDLWQSERKLRLLREVRYTKGEGIC
ncbi:histidine phosphatase family protein [Oscillibacter valericigenes]|uniref:histidine phosphatase family protein n=1 Tax=Oscillibacter valericigenes TaxID=351091 RepID=UPI001F3EFE6D|nr:histidine phosphatase family protein [Oscillibacter valericigenes]MCF2616165.1 histidine phosphatase family protein [Oscillibacter valericigenes]